MSVTLTWAGNNFTFDYGVSAGIQKEFTRADDGSILNEKHNISIRGQIIASGADADARYLNLFQQTASYAQKIAIGGGRTPSIQMGELIITSSTAGELLNYQNVSLQNISISEPSDDTAGIHFQEVSLSFETYNTPSDPTSTYKIRSASENFEIRKEEGSFSYLNNNIHTETTPYHSYTITHTLSAQGLIDKLTNVEAFNAAYDYVNSRKLDSLSTTVNTDNFGRPMLGSSNIDPKLFKIAGNSSIVADQADLANYGEYNKIRTSSCDLTAGSYSLTTTFFLSRQNSTIEINANYNKDENGDASISVDGNIQGLSTLSATSVKHDKIIQARLTYQDVAGDLKSSSKIFQFAQDIYNRYQQDKVGVTLRETPLNYSFGENKNTGTITFNVSYKVYPSAFITLLNGITGALVANASITDSNRNGTGYDTDSIVIIPIIGRTSGPIIQDMSTTKERTRGLTIDVTLEPRYRTIVNNTVRNEVIAAINDYKPVGYQDLYVNDFNESWDWINGKYNVSLNWTYTV